MPATHHALLLGVLLAGCVDYPARVSAGTDGAPCTSDADCAEERCLVSLSMCTEGREGSPCNTGADCGSGQCIASLHACTYGNEGDLCASNADCRSGGCVEATQACTAGGLDDPCDDDTDCASIYECRSDRHVCDRPCRSDCDCGFGDFCGSSRYCIESTLGECFSDDIGRACTTASTCASIPGGYCSVGHFCTKTCTDHRQCGCPLGTTDADILAGGCDTACVDFTEGSFCEPVCRTNADCTSALPVCHLFTGASVGYCGT